MKSSQLTLQERLLLLLLLTLLVLGSAVRYYRYRPVSEPPPEVSSQNTHRDLPTD